MFSILRGERTDFPFPRARATTKISETRSHMEMDTEREEGVTTLAAPLNGLANHAKPEIGSDFGGFAADRGRL